MELELFYLAIKDVICGNDVLQGEGESVGCKAWHSHTSSIK